MLYVDLESINKDACLSVIEMSRYNNAYSANQHVFGPNTPWTFIDCYWCRL